jgi:hypothetical protein
MTTQINVIDFFIDRYSVNFVKCFSYEVNWDSAMDAANGRMGLKCAGL